MTIWRRISEMCFLVLGALIIMAVVLCGLSLVIDDLLTSSGKVIFASELGMYSLPFLVIGGVSLIVDTVLD